MLLLHVEYHSCYDITWYILLSILSWPMISTQYPCLYWPPTFMFSSLLFVECSKHAIVFNSTATLASLHYSGYQGELMLLAWTGSSSSCLDALKFRHGIALCIFSFLETLRFSNWSRCSCDDDFQILGNNRCWILEVNGLVLFNEFESSALFTVDIILKC